MTDHQVGPLRWLARLVAVAGFAIVVSHALRAAWTEISTDFPNYYTAAVAARDHNALRDIYDWTWFVRKENQAGVESEVSGYVPQTPATMLPVLPMAGLPPLPAKHIWLAANLILLAAVLAMLAWIAGVPWEYLVLLLLTGYRSLITNFVYGQWYILLLFLLTLTLACFARRYDGAGGLVAGAAFAMKLYPGPLLLYFAAKRAWRSVFGMLAGAAIVGAAALLLFGWSGIAYYLTHVLPRTFEGNSVDPYHPMTTTFNMVIHRWFLRDAALNPQPAFEAPWLFFFARTVWPLGWTALAILGIVDRADPDRRRELAWMMILLLLISVSTSTHSYILLLAPVAVLLRGASRAMTVYLVASYSLLDLDLPPAFYPKVWMLALLFVVTGYGYLRSIRARRAIMVAAAVVFVSAADAQFRMRNYDIEPARRFPQIAVERDALFSGYPVVTRCGLFFQSMADARRGRSGYVLRWMHDGRLDTFDFGGNELQPRAAADGCGIEFEHVVHGVSTFLRLDPRTARTEAAPAPVDRRPGEGVISPDGRWRARVRETATSRQLWLEDAATGSGKLLAGGSCNNDSPAWEPDSSAVVFASDCGRAFGLPALYRAPVR